MMSGQKLIHLKKNRQAVYVKITVPASRSRAVCRCRCVPLCVKNEITSAQSGLPSSQIHLQRSKYVSAFVREAWGGAFLYVQYCCKCAPMVEKNVLEKSKIVLKQHVKTG